MPIQPIEFAQFSSRVFQLFEQQWLLLTGGDFARGKFNTMTISWGSLGVLWGRPFVQVLVRPSRYTREFLEQFDTFTVSAFPAQYHGALNLLGTKSGRAGDKIAESGLTPVAAAAVAAPTFAEAELVLECRKVYRDRFDPQGFLEPKIESFYPQQDYHTVYFGEIVAIRGDAKYRAV